MSSPEAQQLERLERQIYEYYPHLQRDCEELKCVRRQRLMKQLRIGHPLVEVSRLDAQASVMNLKFLLEGCRSLGMFNEPMYSQSSADVLSRCSQLSESSEDELRHIQGLCRTTRKRKFSAAMVQSSNYRYTKRSRSGYDPDAPLSLTIRLPEILPMKISIGCEQRIQRRHNALNSSSSSNASEVSIRSGKGNRKRMGALPAVDDINPEETASGTTQEDEMLTRLISEVLVEPEVAETWRATSVLDNINNNVGNNYDVHTTPVSISRQKSKKGKKQPKKQTKDPNEPPKKRGRKKKNAVNKDVESNANDFPKSDLAKYVELFSNSCNMTGCTTPAHTATTSTAQQSILGVQEPVTYYIETDWSNSGNCQLIPTEAVSVEGTQEEFNMTELVDYIENVDNDAGNVIASVLDAPGTIIPVTSNMQVPMQHLQIYQPQTHIRPTRRCEGVLDLSKKSTTALRTSLALVAEPVVVSDGDCVPLDLSMKSATVLMRPTTSRSSPRTSQTATQGHFIGDDYDSFNAALDMPIIDIDDNMSAFMEMTNRATIDITGTRTTLPVVENIHSMNQVKNVATLPTLVDVSETSNRGVVDYTLDLPNELLEINNNGNSSNIELLKNKYQTTENCVDAVIPNGVHKSVEKNAEIINSTSCSIIRNINKRKIITKHSEYIANSVTDHNDTNTANSITDSRANEPIIDCVVDLERHSCVGHARNAEEIKEKNENEVNTSQVDCDTCLDLSKSNINVLGNHDNTIHDLGDITIKNDVVIGNVTSEGNCNDIAFNVNSTEQNVNMKTATEHKKYIKLNDSKEECSDSATVLELSYSSSSFHEIAANSVFNKGYEESNSVSSVKSPSIDIVSKANDTAELSDRSQNKSDGKPEKGESEDKYTCVVDDSNKGIIIEHASKGIAQNVMKNVIDNKGHNRFNKARIGNSQSTLNDEKLDTKSIGSSDDAGGSLSDKVSVDLLFVDVESLPLHKSTSKTRAITLAQKCKYDTLNYKTEAMRSNNTSLKQGNNEHSINNESFNSIDLVETAEDNDSINIQMPQLTLIEHNLEEFAALHLDRDSENGFESSDSMVVEENEKVCVKDYGIVEASKNSNINKDEKNVNVPTVLIGTIKKETSNATRDIVVKVDDMPIDVEEKPCPQSISIKVKGNEDSIDIQEKINEQSVDVIGKGNEHPIDIEEKYSVNPINVERPIDVKVKSNEQPMDIETGSVVGQPLNTKCKEPREEIKLDINEEVLNEEKNSVEHPQNERQNQQSMDLNLGTNVIVVTSEQLTDVIVEKINSPRLLCMEVEEASQKVEGSKPSCSAKSKQDTDLFTSLSVLEMESKLDDVCLDFEGEMDDDALSLATSCFNSPDEDRFGDISVNMEASGDMKNEIADFDDFENYIKPTCIETKSNTASSKTSNDSNLMLNATTLATVGLKKFKIPKISTAVAVTTREKSPKTIQPPMVVLPPSTTITSQELMSRPGGLEKLTRTVQNVCAVPPLPLQPTALIAASVAAVTNSGIAPVPSRIRDILHLPPTSVKLTKEYTLNELGESENETKLNRGVLAGKGGDGLNYGPDTLDVAKTFGITCLPFLVNKCFALASCQLSHTFRDVEVVENFLETLTESDLSVAYKFMYNHVCLFRHYFKVFCKVYARRNNRNKLLNMVYDCMRYGDCVESLRTLFCSLVHCGFSKVNACRQILSRNREKSRSIIDVLVNIIMESDWTMFCDYIERFTETPSYHFRINVLNQMAPTVLRANNPRLAAIFFKCLVDLEPDDVALVQHSPAMLQLLELTKSGKMCC